MKVAQSCLTLCKSVDYIAHGILQARILEWVAFLFSRVSFQPRDRAQISHIAGRFFTSWATVKEQEYWSEWPLPSPGDLPDPGIEPGSPALQVDSLPPKLWGKPMVYFAKNQRSLRARELMLLSYASGEDSWESLGLQGDETNQP